MAEIVYLLCGLTSTWCAFLLFRGWRENRTKLLFWSGICFLCLALNNILLFVDLVLVPEMDLGVYRNGLVAAGLLVLVKGMISETV